MNKNNKVLIISDHHDINSINITNYRAVFWLFWLAPSTKAALQWPKDILIFSLHDLVGDEMNWSKHAYELASKICSYGPQYNNLFLRSYLTEPLYNDSFFPYLAKRVIETCEHLRVGWDFDSLALEGYLPKAHSELFSQYLSGNPCLIWKGTWLHPESIPSTKSPTVNSLKQRLKEVWEKQDWYTQFRDTVEWLDKTYRYRCFIGSKLKRAVEKGGITFFSSYQNNSRILDNFVDIMPSPVTWLLTNYSALKGMSQKQSKFHWIWQFANKIGLNLQETHDLLSPEDRALPEVAYITNTSTWNNWKETECQLLANLTAAWENYLDESEPRLIVMASQLGIEGWFMELAKRRGIPVLLVMHGILGGFLHTGTPILADAMITPGEFWKHLWPEEQQAKILVFNPYGYFDKISRAVGRPLKNLTFFSWPLTMIPYYNYYEFTDAFLNIFHDMLSESDIEITIRTHPLENPHDILGRWRKLYGRMAARMKIVNHNDPLNVTLEKTDIAIMYRSTVMLNCLTNGIPVIIPGWIDYCWNDKLHNLSNCFLAPDFQAIKDQVTYWINEKNLLPQDYMQHFVRIPDEGKDYIQYFIKNLMDN